MTVEVVVVVVVMLVSRVRTWRDTRWRAFVFCRGRTIDNGYDHTAPLSNTYS